ncbi:hypothetical protein ACX27_23790 [Nostoc piscinale CENA21]|uniref:Uncharacterized protein n=1 Tax=Nostoc piscinale CENA21 TaxID=224013 RepID=A0A0M3V673_9NOSO|nr:hypothetical protein [Nostoc piscinale]ALF55163.1 hypothetical protein ACX27_23790 [Nostoc piscinale CENA21]
MSTVSCSSCVVILNQQQEQNISHQHQCQNQPINHSQNTSKNSTVVKNGRVVVISEQAQSQQTNESENA